MASARRRTLQGGLRLRISIRFYTLKFLALLKRMKNLAKTRNAIAHSLIGVSLNGKQKALMGLTFSDAMDGGLDFRFKDFPMKDLADHAYALETLKRDWIEMIIQCDGRIYKDARVHREQPRDPNAELLPSRIVRITASRHD